MYKSLNWHIKLIPFPYLPVVCKLIGIVEKHVVAELAVYISEARAEPERWIMMSPRLKVIIETSEVD